MDCMGYSLGIVTEVSSVKMRGFNLTWYLGCRQTFPWKPSRFTRENRDFIGFLLVRDLNVTLHGICERSFGISKDVPNMA